MYEVMGSIPRSKTTNKQKYQTPKRHRGTLRTYYYVKEINLKKGAHCVIFGV
jgi:hypothetical protein